ncbi:MAG: 1-(5-phosphoribosyl)-5-amino-4-imidazole-carboxylate carboxylase [bacterium]|nr:MAG: 1-(5-phosphoribosyl)-5-amino-4-imidazole-carboxylate carboxylase [bacterium]
MDKNKLKKTLEQVQSGKLSPGKASGIINSMGYEDIVFAKPDHHRQKRLGFCEVIFCPGKTSKQIAEIARKLLAHSDSLLATRGDRKIYNAIKKVSAKAKFHEPSGVITIEKRRKIRRGNLLVMTAGTSDIPVAEEAALTADIMGTNVTTVYDVGVAGIHRLLDQKKALYEADCIVVVAGMDGALASVVGGMVSAPVVAVPTSVGYGAVFDGIAPLLAMLNSCAAGIGVVNINNGFGAGALAHRIVSTAYGSR